MLHVEEKKEKIYPLSMNQYGLWFFDRLVPNSPLYSVPWMVRITGELNVAALQEALQAVWERHDVLRSKIRMANEKPFVVVSNEREVPFAIIDVAQDGMNPQAVEDRVTGMLLEHSLQPFDLYRDTLMRSILFSCGAGRYILFFNMHHIIFDGWSMEILLREIAEVYNARSAGAAAVLPPLQHDFFDFAKWQKKMVQGDEKTQLLEYWRNKLKEPLTGSQFPADHARAQEQSYSGSIVTKKLPKDLSDKLIELAKKERVTPYMVFLAGLQVLLHTYTGSSEIVIGSPMAGRSNSEFESVIGYIVNLVPLKISCRGDMACKELLREVRRTTLEAYSNQAIPLDVLISELLPSRSSAEPFIRTVFAYEDDATLGISMNGVELSPIEGLPTNTSKFDLTWTITNKGDFYELNVEFATDLYAETTIHRLIQHYENALESIAKSPESKVSQIAIFTEKEEKILTEGNILVLNQHLQLAPIGTPGDLYISDVSLEQQYMRQNAELEKHLVDHPFKEGSQLIRAGRAKRNADGSIHIIELFGFRPEDEDHLHPADRTEAVSDKLETVAGQEILKIWKEVLGVEDIHADDSFFELGGHSLLAIQIIVRVRESFGIDVPLRSLFEAEDIVAFITAVEDCFARDHDQRSFEKEAEVAE
ncbi:condensation domain-containing protein [Brevibacillus sp. TJ4]|uniref:condensation domain-containing protein n=1 Tax=Brevibacillus sp. TJ4 TaxID=3234853 RepID=UPI0037CEDD75